MLLAQPAQQNGSSSEHSDIQVQILSTSSCSVQRGCHDSHGVTVWQAKLNQGCKALIIHVARTRLRYIGHDIFFRDPAWKKHKSNPQSREASTPQRLESNWFELMRIVAKYDSSACVHPLKAEKQWENSHLPSDGLGFRFWKLLFNICLGILYIVRSKLYIIE